MSRRLSPLVFLLASLVMMGAEGRALENKRLYGKHTLDAAADSQADAQADTKAGLGASKTAGDMEGVPPTPTVFPLLTPARPGWSGASKRGRGFVVWWWCFVVQLRVCTLLRSTVSEFPRTARRTQLSVRVLAARPDAFVAKPCGHRPVSTCCLHLLVVQPQ